MAKITYTNKVTGDTVSAADMNEIKSSVNTNDDTAIALAATVAAKVDKVTGKQLSTEDYTTAEKTKLSALPLAADLATTLAAKADLVAGKVPAGQLPSYVDDVLEFANLAAFPATGESGKLYVTLDTNFTYRWATSVYVRVDSVDLTGYATTSSVNTGLAGKQATLQSGTNIKTINGTSLLGSGDLVISGGGSSREVANNSNLKNWLLKLATDPANAVLQNWGDSTSDFAGNAASFPGLVGEYIGTGQLLDGFDIDNMPNRGVSGLKLADFISGSGLTALVAEAPNIDLLVLSFGINDVRVNSATAEQISTMLLTVMDAATTANPNISILLRMPNNFLTVSPNGYIEQGSYPSLAAAAQAQSEILYSAYKAIEFARSNAVLMDTQEYIFGRTCKASSPLMNDEIHPNYNGIVELLVETIGYTEPFKIEYSNAAIAANFSQPWTVYNKALHDTSYYKELIKGKINFIGSTFLDVSCDPYTMQKIFPNDIISIGDKFFFNRAEANVLNDGVLRLSFDAGTLTGNTVTKGTVAIYRSLYNNTPLTQRYVKDTNNYPYRRYVSISTSGTYLYLGTQNEGLYPYLNALRVKGGDMVLQAGDILIPEGATAPIVLANSGGKLNDDVLYIDQGVDVSSANGKIGMLFGNHLYEV